MRALSEEAPHAPDACRGTVVPLHYLAPRSRRRGPDCDFACFLRGGLAVLGANGDGAPPQARMQIFKICTGQDDRIHTSQCTVNYIRPLFSLDASHIRISTPQQVRWTMDSGGFGGWSGEEETLCICRGDSEYYERDRRAPERPRVGEAQAAKLLCRGESSQVIATTA